jgi:cell division protein FtsL
MKARITRMLKDSLRIGVTVAALSVVGSLLMFHVYTQYQIVELGYDIANVTSEHRRLLEQNKKLAIEAAVVGRTERVSSVAKERFGLEPVRPEQVQTLGIDAVSANDVSNQEVAVQ